LVGLADMDTQDNFSGWNNIVNDWIRQMGKIYKHLPVELRQDTKPSMYNILLINSSDITDELFKLIATEYLHLQEDKISNALDALRTYGQLFCGTYTREIAEVKIIGIINFAYNNNHEIKCIMCKDREYVVKKS
jgi:ATP-dependent Clp protease adaptor protein ClpS